MESYDSIIESLTVQLSESHVFQLGAAFSIEHYYEIEVTNTLIFVQKGQLYFGAERRLVEAGEALFLPEGKGVSIHFLEREPKRILGSDYHTEYKTLFDVSSEPKKAQGVFIFIRFSAKVFNAVNLFGSLDILPFVVKEDRKVQQLMGEIREETQEQEIGKENMLTCKTKELVIRLFRHIIDRKLFIQQITTNSNNLRDSRLIKIFRYINENLAGDLSNKALAAEVHTSQDYVGQYFKTLTGINPQDYIEFQRMQAAIALLRGSSKSIQDIGRSVGYKDSSYFCRRFKMMFGISAGRMRRRDRVLQARK